jgi:hypothetical protein
MTISFTEIVRLIWQAQVHPIVALAISLHFQFKTKAINCTYAFRFRATLFATRASSAI